LILSEATPISAKKHSLIGVFFFDYGRITEKTEKTEMGLRFALAGVSPRITRIFILVAALKIFRKSIRKS
jgi:hypothetical protein